MKEIILLGSTGSIGAQVLQTARLHKIKIKALAAGSNIELLTKQAREFCPEYVCVADESKYHELKSLLSDMDNGPKIFCGAVGLCDVAALSCDLLVNAIVGMAGFMPTLTALKAGNGVALANKETLVVGGEIITDIAKRNGVPLIPIDSEHSAIFQCLLGSGENKPKKLILTASGGPFKGFSREKLKNVTKKEALKHPNWNMGAKITIDSATMMNKGLELIEAVWLFGVRPEQVEIVIHPQSILHSAVEFEDGAVIAQMGVPDMKIPIQFALSYPKRLTSDSKALSLVEIGALTFEKPDEEAFPCLKLAKKAFLRGGNMPCIMNKANEIAVKMFLEDKIRFFEIPETIAEAMERVDFISDISEEIILKTQAKTQSITEQFLSHKI